MLVDEKRREKDGSDGGDFDHSNAGANMLSDNEIRMILHARNLCDVERLGVKSIFSVYFFFIFCLFCQFFLIFNSFIAE